MFVFVITKNICCIRGDEIIVMEEGTAKQMLTFYRAFSSFCLLEIFGCLPLPNIRFFLAWLS